MDRSAKGATSPPRLTVVPPNWPTGARCTSAAFAALVICAHPVTEVLLSIYRRKVRKTDPGMPDKLHFHSLVKRRYVSRWFRHLPRTLRNSITGAIIGLMTLTAVVLANFTYASAPMSAAVYVALALGYVAIYARMVRHHWCSPITFLLRKPAIRPRSVT
mgnify:CR=1 FL=1